MNIDSALVMEFGAGISYACVMSRMKDIKMNLIPLFTISNIYNSNGCRHKYQLV
jgi:hypothetical protein